MKHLAKLHAEATAALAEIVRLEEKSGRLQLEEKEIIAAGNIEDPAIFKQVSDIRLMLDLIPRKTAQNLQFAEAVSAQIVEEIAKTKHRVFEIWQRIHRETQAKLKKALEPFALEASGPTDSLIEQLTAQTAAVTKAQHLENAVHAAHGNARFDAPVETVLKQARYVIEAFAAFTGEKAA